MEGHLGGGTYTQQYIAADEDRDALRSRTNDGPDDTDYAAANEEVPPTKDVCETAERSKEDSERSIINERNPGVPWVGSNVCVDLC